MPEETKCIICDNSVRVVIENLEGYQEGENFKIYYCSSCDTAFSWPHIINEKTYDHIYSQVNIVPGYNRYSVFANEIANSSNALQYLADKEATYFAIKETLATNKDKTTKLLEVGSGLGYLTYAIAQEGYNITGLDISKDAVNKATQRFGKHYVCRDVYEYAVDFPGAFDIIILTEVIEHIPDPKAFCQTLSTLLKPGGKLIITTPNKSAFPAGEFWETELPPVHLSWFSEDSFKSIAQQMGLAVSFFDFTGFNKKHIDISRFIFYDRFYKIKKRASVLDKNGKIIFPVFLKNRDTTKEKIKTMIKKSLKPFYIFFLTHKRNMNRNGVLCVILEKNRQ